MIDGAESSDERHTNERTSHPEGTHRFASDCWRPRVGVSRKDRSVSNSTPTACDPKAWALSATVLDSSVTGVTRGACISMISLGFIGSATRVCVTDRNGRIEALIRETHHVCLS